MAHGEPHGCLRLGAVLSCRRGLRYWRTLLYGGGAGGGTSPEGPSSRVGKDCGGFCLRLTFILLLLLLITAPKCSPRTRLSIATSGSCSSSLRIELSFLSCSCCPPLHLHGALPIICPDPFGRLSLLQNRTWKAFPKAETLRVLDASTSCTPTLARTSNTGKRTKKINKTKQSCSGTGSRIKNILLSSNPFRSALSLDASTSSKDVPALRFATH